MGCGVYYLYASDNIQVTKDFLSFFETTESFPRWLSYITNYLIPNFLFYYAYIDC